MAYVIHVMFRGCMYSDPMSAKLVEATNSFVKATMEYMENNVRCDGYIHFPYVDCKN